MFALDQFSILSGSSWILFLTSRELGTPPSLVFADLISLIEAVYKDIEEHWGQDRDLRHPLLSIPVGSIGSYGVTSVVTLPFLEGSFVPRRHTYGREGVAHRCMALLWQAAFDPSPPHCVCIASKWGNSGCWGCGRVGGVGGELVQGAGIIRPALGWRIGQVRHCFT